MRLRPTLPIEPLSEMFHPTGAFGSFGVKINIALPNGAHAYLCGPPTKSCCHSLISFNVS